MQLSTRAISAVTAVSGRRTLAALLGLAAAIAVAAALVIPPPNASVSDNKARTASKDAKGRVDEAVTGYTANMSGGAADVAPTDSSTSQPGAVDGEMPMSETSKDTADTSVGTSSAGGSSGLAALEAKIIQTGSVTLRVKKGEVSEAFSQARAIATAMGGYVVSSEMATTEDGEPQTALLSIRVPNGRFDVANTRLAALGKVISQNVSAQDVTQDYVDAKSRLSHDEAVASRLLQLLARTKTVSEALAVQDRLDTIQSQIEVEKGRMQYLERMTTYATIDVSLTEKGAGATTKKHAKDTWGINGAFDRAAHRFVGNINRAIVATGGALPAIIVMLLGLFGARRLLRRRPAATRVAVTEGRGSDRTPV